MAGAVGGDSRMTTDQIICGDAVDVLPTLGVKANLILTSPPYDNLRTYGGHGFDFNQVADACVGALTEGGVLVWVVADATVDGSETGTSFRQALGFMERGLRLHDTMIWQKTDAATSWAPKRYDQEYEYMFVLSAWRAIHGQYFERSAKSHAYWVKVAGQPAGRRKTNGDLARVRGRPIPQKYGRRRNKRWGYASCGLRASDGI